MDTIENIENIALESDKKKSTQATHEMTVYKPDRYIWGVFICLCIVSLVETYSASSREVSKSGVYLPIIKHAIFLLCGGGIAYYLQSIRYSKLIKGIPLFGLLTLVLLIIAEFFGSGNINGASRAISIPLIGFTIQPAEMAKLGVVLFVAWATARNQRVNDVSNLGVFLSVVSVSIFGFFLLKQGLTNTLLLMSISFSMLFISGTSIKKIGFVIIFYALVAVLFFGYLQLSDDKDNKATNVANTGQTVTDKTNSEKTDKLSSVFGRVFTWSSRVKDFNDSVPLWKQPITPKNQQTQYSLMAQAHGGAIGVFPGNSRECSRLPLAFSDYVFSIIIEETGLVGGLIILILYLSLLGRAGFIAYKCARALPTLLIMGMALLIVYQALFHMAINTHVVPVSGQPLPLISNGGTSIIIISIAFGIMLSVGCSAARKDKPKDVKAEKSTLPQEMQAETKE